MADGLVPSGDKPVRHGELILVYGRRLSEMVEQTLQLSSSAAGK